MSLQLGKANRFAGASRSGATTGQLFPNRVKPGLLRRPTIPQAWQHINVGPELTLSFEANQALPVDGSNSMLRNLSPFTIQVEPPLVFANEPTSTGKSRATGIFDAAFSSSGGTSGKNTDGAASFHAAGAVGGGDPEEIVARNYPGPQSQKSGDGKLTQSKTGVGKLGNPQITDLYTALDIVTQLGAAMNSPPLVLLINPQNLTLNYNRLHQFSDRSRFGYIYQALGEDQPKLSITAKCGAFYSGGRGVQLASRRDSASWQNLMSLFHLYRSNGYFYDTLGKSNAHLFVGGLSIHYDGWIYYGNMESFSWTYEEANQLGGVEFQMEFVVSVMVDTSKQTQTVLPMKAPLPNPNDPRYWMNAGTPQVGGNTLSVGLDGNVRGRFFGYTAPAERSTPGNQGFGDSDFVGRTSVKLGSNATVSRGGGFVATPTTVSNASSTTTQRPAPFRRGS